MKKIYIILAIMLVKVTALVCGCSATTTITQQPVTTVTKTVTAPQYSTHTMTLTHDNNIGTYPIYLQSNDILHLLWSTGNQTTTNFDITTPSGKGFTFDSSNTLSQTTGADLSGGVKNISPSDLGDGAGYYTMVVGGNGAPVTVEIDYWIESK